MTAAPGTPLISVLDQRRVCIGHLLRRFDGSEAFDRSDRSLGVFPTVDEAAAALWRARNEVQP
jgi:hypothetical protein